MQSIDVLFIERRLLFATYHWLQFELMTIRSVRSREGRRNRAPPPRVRYNKDGKKVNPQQAAKVAVGAVA